MAIHETWDSRRFDSVASHDKKNKEMEREILVSKEIREKLTSKDGYGFNHVTVRKALRGDVSTLKRQQIRETALKEGGVYKN